MFYVYMYMFINIPTKTSQLAPYIFIFVKSLLVNVDFKFNKRHHPLQRLHALLYINNKAANKPIRSFTPHNRKFLRRRKLDSVAEKNSALFSKAIYSRPPALYPMFNFICEDALERELCKISSLGAWRCTSALQKGHPVWKNTQARINIIGTRSRSPRPLLSGQFSTGCWGKDFLAKIQLRRSLMRRCLS